ncbi:thioesterase family protein [Mesorhizobium sp. 2RAF21]|uniref:thioesterase family protein n=1 Tax=Mesorhizobium sp. 2RAF21 TaxID=3232995 RepID=UPI003F9615C5
MTHKLEPGDKDTVQNIVSPDRTAAAFAAEPGESFPSVLATPFLIADMERACARLLKPLLGHGELSVGAHIDVRHVAPTGVGGRYRATATFSEEKPPLYWFDVVAEDAMGVIGKGRIARAIVREDAIVARGNASAQS